MKAGGGSASLPAPTLEHPALFYRSQDEFVAGTAPFVQAGLDAGEPVLVSVPGVRIVPLRAALRGPVERVRFADMTEVGRNPARIIPFVARFVAEHAGRRVRFVGEPIWPGRSAAETRECVRHEALLNAAFAAADIAICCPYDVAALDPKIQLDAERTHPLVGPAGQWRVSPHYTDPEVLYAAADRPLPEPPGRARAVPFGAGDLPRLRALIRRRARRAGVPAARAGDLLVAVNEVTTNTLTHTGAGGTLRIWLDRVVGELICELRDTGHIRDLLAGRRRPALNADHGRGLWLANQLCDLVELRSGEQGTVIRLHARLDG